MTRLNPISILKHTETTTSDPLSNSTNATSSHLSSSFSLRMDSINSAGCAQGLEGIEALTFDVFGTVVDWHGSVVRALEKKAEESGGKATAEWALFAREWRAGYYTMTSRRAVEGAEGSLSVDVMHREILEALLKTERWSHLAPIWNEKDRQELVMIWHRLDGWPDSSAGLYELKKKYIIATLSNGNVKLLADMAKYSDLPWDVIFSGELLGTYKPNPKIYLLAAHHLSLPTHKIGMVAAHIHDLRAAAKVGMKTIYVRRPTEDEEGVRTSVRSVREGGEVDVIVDGFGELARELGCARARGDGDEDEDVDAGAGAGAGAGEDSG